MLNDQKLTPSLLILILAMIALMQLSVDLYTPSFPAIQSSLNTTLSAVQISLSLFMLGFSCSHPVFGPLSDRIGRKKPIIAGISIHALGSFICIFSPTIAVLIIGRFLQGFGIGCCNSVGRSLARDLLSSNRLAQVGAQIGMASVIFLALSPMIGGYIQDYLGWRFGFILLFLMALVLIVAVIFFLPETNLKPDPAATTIQSMKRNYHTLLVSPVFMGYTLCACFAGAGIVAYLAIAPFLLQEVYGLTPVEFGWLAFIIAGSIFFSGLLNQLLVMKKGIPLMLFCGCIMMFVGGVLMLLFDVLGLIQVETLMLAVAIFCIGAGLTFMNAFAGAFDPFPHIAGTTGALYGFMQDLTAALVSIVIAIISITNAVILGLVLTLLSILSICSYRFLIQNHKAGWR